MNNTGVTGLTAKYDIRHTDIYISREISIEHPSVGLASLAQLYVCRCVGMSVCRYVGMFVVCQINCVGGIT